MTPFNIKRIVGYGFIAVILVLALTGCALFPSSFDSNEHARLVTIHVASSDAGICQDRDAAARTAREMYADARWVWNYGQYLTNNEKMGKMEQELLAMTKELADRYAQAGTVSAFYCRSKFENIHRATTTIIKVSARRPRI